MDKTPLELALAEMERGDQPARIAFFSTFLTSEIFLALTEEAQGDQISPQIFETEDGPFVLGFDRLEALADFSPEPLPYAGLSGRALAAMLAGQDVGVLLTLGVGESAHAVTAEELDWLQNSLPEDAQEIDVKALELLPPTGLPETLLTALATKLAAAQGAAAYAYLAGARYSGGQEHLLAFIDPAPGAEAALVALVNEALAFSGIEAGTLDVAFFDASDPMAARLARVGVGFEIPAPDRAAPLTAPGSDPDRPPKLR